MLRYSERIRSFFMRKLASIQKILEIQPIPNADRILMARVLGWRVVVTKVDNFKVGDLCVYIEIDSILPNEDWCGFLRPNHREPKVSDFRIRTRKFRKQISQGIVFPLKILEDKLTPKQLSKLKEGDEVTKTLNVIKYEPWKKKSFTYTSPPKNIWEKIQRWWAQRKYYRKKKRMMFPSYIPQTSETRIQASPSILRNHQGDLAFVTEKIDGCSGTYIMNKGKFIVCSRTVRVKNGGYNSHVYWKVADNEDIKAKLKKYGRNIAIQGEIIGDCNLNSRLGPRNKYHRPELELYVFNVYDIDRQRYYDHFEFRAFIDKTKFKQVPKLPSITLPTMEELLPGETLVDRLIQLSAGKSLLYGSQIREGIVVRSRECQGKWDFSFKVVDPKFLLQKVTPQ